MGRFENQVAFVTGGVSGIGLGGAMAFAREGADVMITDVSPGEAALEAIRALGRKAEYVRLDVTDPEAVEAAVAQATEKLGPVTLCLAAAGIGDGRVGAERPTDAASFGQRFCTEKSWAEWRRVIDVNLNGVYYTDVAVARAMVAHGKGGSIVNVASVASKAVMPGGAEYAASKTAVWSLTRTLSRELAPHKIRVNAIGPGWTESGLTRPLFENNAIASQLLASVPLGRFTDPDEVAHTIVFLCGPEGAYYTGSLLHPDGGISPW